MADNALLELAKHLRTTFNGATTPFETLPASVQAAWIEQARVILNLLQRTR